MKWGKANSSKRRLQAYIGPRDGFFEWVTRPRLYVFNGDDGGEKSENSCDDYTVKVVYKAS